MTFEAQTHMKPTPPPPGKEILNKVGRRKFILIKGLRQAIGKPHVKGYNHGRRSRTYPNITSSRNSIQGCSESAIEFSQHQMHGIENVAESLMKELDSMKIIFEQKLVFHNHFTGSLTNDIDEVCILLL